MRIAPLLLGAAGLAASLAFAPLAQAKGLDACGNLYFEAEGNFECEVYVDPPECKAKCEPLTFEAECAAELQVGCEGECNVTAEASCTSSCQGSCEASCSGGEFDCEAYCEGNCTADCDAQCSASSNKGECRASCEATCQGECAAGCNVQQPDCQAQCQGCCSGECTAEVNMDCQIDCQASGYVDCKAQLQGGCEAQCDSGDGAMFCDGQYVQATNIDDCAAALADYFSIEVQFYSDAECSGNSCKAEAGCSADCAAAPSDSDFSFGLMALGMATFGLAFGRRVVKRRK